MKHLILIICFLSTSGIFAQQTSVTFEESHITFSGDKKDYKQDRQILEITGNVHFTTDIVEIEKAEKIIYDRKTKTFTISGFKMLRLNGKQKPASDFGETTLKVDLGECVAYLVVDNKACPGGKSGDC